jgi:hypothetical protein
MTAKASSSCSHRDNCYGPAEVLFEFGTLQYGPAILHAACRSFRSNKLAPNSWKRSKATGGGGVGRWYTSSCLSAADPKRCRSSAQSSF